MTDKKIYLDQVLLFKSENQEIKNVHPLSHAFRLNGVVDIFKYGFCVYDINNNIYHKFEKIADVFSMAINVVRNNEEKPVFDSRRNGKITFKTFAKRAAISDWRPEEDHWKVHADKKSEDHLYFMSDGMGRVKIGRSSNPDQRVKGLNTGNASRVRLMMIVENKGCLEKNLHNCFSELKIRGEWFSHTQRIDQFIEHVKNNNNGCKVIFRGVRLLKKQNTKRQIRRTR